MPTPHRPVLLLLAAALAAGCTGQVRSFAVYESKAGRTAAVAASAVQTALLAADAARGRRAFGRYLQQVLAEAEDDASAAQGTFDAIQPPDHAADRLRARLDELLADAVQRLGDLRITARRGQLELLVRLAEPLPRLAEQLDAFARAHQ